MPSLMVEIIAYAPTQFYQCRSCEFVMDQAKIDGVKAFHVDTLETSMPSDLMQAYRNLSEWVINAAEHYGGRVVFKVVDAASMEGFFKSLKYRVRKYPAVIIDGKAKTIGDDFHQAEVLIDQQLAHQLTSA